MFQFAVLLMKFLNYIVESLADSERKRLYESDVALKFLRKVDEAVKKADDARNSVTTDGLRESDGHRRD